MKFRFEKAIVITCLLVCGLASVSCSNKDSEKAPSPPGMGGVDGSGGNLSYWDQQSLKEWVREDHKYYVRDVVHRLLQIKQHTPEVFKYSELANKFLGDDPRELWKLLDSVTYDMQEGPCPANNHEGGLSDASVTGDGKICFSYSAFKNLTLESLEPKILTMTMHELSHLRGFNEKEAEQWQLYFEKHLKEQVVLYFNKEYRLYRETLQKISEKAANALDVLSDREEGFHERACAFVLLAHDRIDDLSHWMQGRPGYLNQYIFDQVSTKLVRATAYCKKLSDSELALSLESILGSFVEMGKMLTHFEFPKCGDNLCPGRGFTYADQVLVQWLTRKEQFLKGKEYTPTDAHDVKCELYDEESGTWFESESEESEGTISIKFLSDNVLVKSLNWLFYHNSKPTGGIESEVMVDLGHDGPIWLLQSDGFSASTYSLRGFLQAGSKQEISARFALMDPNQRAPYLYPGYLFPSIDHAYYVRDPYYQSIQVSPSEIRSYKLTCKL